MAHLLKNLNNSIWHAFHALQQGDTANSVAKSKLKVIFFLICQRQWTDEQV